MRKFKDFLALFIAAAMIFSMVPAVAFASGEATITVGSITQAVEPGATISIPVTIANNPGFAGAVFDVEYDVNVLEPDTKLFKLGSAIKAAVDDEATNMSLTANSSAGLSADDNNFVDDGEILTLNFKVKETAAVSSTTVSLKLQGGFASNFSDINSVPVGVTFVPGTVAINVNDSDKTVTFYGSDLETSIGSVTVAFRETLEAETLPTATAPAGKVFAGWYTAKPTDNGTKVTPGTKLDVHEDVTADMSVYPVFVASGNEVMIEAADGTITPCATLKAAIDGDTPAAGDGDTVRLVKDVEITGSGTGVYDISALTVLNMDLNGHSVSGSYTGSGAGYSYLFKMNAQLLTLTLENTCAEGMFSPSITGSWNGVFGVPSNSSSSTTMVFNIKNVVTTSGNLFIFDSQRTAVFNIYGSTIDSGIINPSGESNGSSTKTVNVYSGSKWKDGVFYSTNVNYETDYGPLAMSDGYTHVVLHPESYHLVKGYATDGQTLKDIGNISVTAEDTTALNSINTARNSYIWSDDQGTYRRHFTFLGWATSADATTPDLSSIVSGDIIYPIYSFTDASVSIAEYNGTGYPTIKAALAAAESATSQVTIKLLEDWSEFIVLTSSTPDVVFDLNGKTLSNPLTGNPDPDDTTSSGIFFFKCENATTPKLTIVDNSNNHTGTVKLIYRSDAIQKVLGFSDPSDTRIYDIHIKGGSFTKSKDGTSVYFGSSSNSTVTVYGGRFYVDKIYDADASYQLDPTNYVATSSHVNLDNGWWVVSAHEAASTWSKDENTHWHSCTDEDCTGVKLDEAQHTWNEGIVTQPATIASAGQKTVTCTVCGMIDKQVIPQLTDYTATVTLSNATDRNSTTSAIDMYYGDTVTVSVKVDGADYVAADVTLTYDSTLFDGPAELPSGWNTVNGGYRYIKDGSFTDGEVLGSFVFTAKAQSEAKTGSFAISKAYIAETAENGWDTNPANMRNTSSVSVEIVASPMTAKVTAASDLVYTGNAQALLTEATTVEDVANITVLYSNDEGESYTETAIPTGTNAGDYTVYYQISAPGYIPVTGTKNVSIAKADITGYSSSTVTLTSTSVAYDGTAHVVPLSISPASGATEGVSKEYSTDGGTSWSTSVPSCTTVGEYSIKVKISKENYNDLEIAVGTFTVVPGTMTASVTAATGLVYTGSAQTLLTELTTVETVADLTVKYSNDNGKSYTETSVPTGTNSGNYTVYYQLSAPGYTTVTGTKDVEIAKADIVGYTATLSETSIFCDGVAHEPLSVVPGDNATADVTLTYSVDNGTTWSASEPSLAAIGEYTIKVKVSKANYNDKTVEAGTYSIKDAAQVVEITNDYVNGYDLVLVFTNTAAKFTYDSANMYDVSALGYKYGTTWGDSETVTAVGTEYTYVYAAVVTSADASKLAVSNAATVVGTLTRGTTDRDVNGSNSVDLYDYVAVQAVYNVNSSYLSGHLDIVLKADVSGNKKVDTQDVALIKAYMLAH